MGTPLFGHVLGVFSTCTPHLMMRAPGNALPFHVLSRKVFVIDNMYPALAKVISETNYKVRPGLFVGIDHDNEIIDEEGEWDSISREFTGVGTTAGETTVRGMVIVKRELTAFLVDVLVMGKMESPEIRIRLERLANVVNIAWYPVNAGSREDYIDGCQIRTMVMGTRQYSPEMKRRVGKRNDGQAHLDAGIADSECTKLLAECTSTPLQPCKPALMYRIG
ncbi:hypothetical protein EDD17DRAFT_1627696 [Pisolithus thermaeus]|nr:hypothetical protein EDD17DRAFT_1627696 [Pisolithus thermaeus]